MPTRKVTDPLLKARLSGWFSFSPGGMLVPRIVDLLNPKKKWWIQSRKSIKLPMWKFFNSLSKLGSMLRFIEVGPIQKHRFFHGCVRRTAQFRPDKCVGCRHSRNDSTIQITCESTLQQHSQRTSAEFNSKKGPWKHHGYMTFPPLLLGYNTSPSVFWEAASFRDFERHNFDLCQIGLSLPVTVANEGL